MIWTKAFLETRSRVWWAVGLAVLLAGWHLFGSPFVLQRARAHPERISENAGPYANIQVSGKPGSPEFARQVSLNVYTQLAAFVTLVIAVCLAGAGLNTQSAYGMRQGLHPSIYFTLSLPVPRRRWLITRAIAGLLELIGFIVLSLLLPCLLRLPQRMGFDEALTYIPFFAGGALLLYSLATLLGGILDELWQATVSMLLIGLLIGVSAALGPFNIIHLMCAGDYLKNGNLPWTGLAWCILPSILLFGATAAIIERKEF